MSTKPTEIIGHDVETSRQRALGLGLVSFALAGVQSVKYWNVFPLDSELVGSKYVNFVSLRQTYIYFMFGRKKSKYDLSIPMLAQFEIEQSGTLSPQNRSAIIEETFKDHFMEEVNVTEYRAERGTTQRVEKTTTELKRGKAPQGTSRVGVIATGFCIIVALLAFFGFITNHTVTNKFLNIIGNDTLKLSTIFLLAAFIFASPMIHRFLFPAIYIYLAYQEFTVGLGWVNSVLLVGLIPYYWVVRKQMKRNEEVTEKKMKAEINEEIDRYLLEVRRKMNRRNV